MNNKTAIGLVAAVIIVGILIFAFGSHVPSNVQIPLGNTPASTGATSTVTTSTSQPAAPAAPAAVSQSKPTTPRLTAIAPTAAFDVHNETTSSPRPILTGTANGSPVELVITNSKGVGIVGASINVENGHWRYVPALALTPGTYKLQVVAGSLVVADSLTITAQ